MVRIEKDKIEDVLKLTMEIINNGYIPYISTITKNGVEYFKIGIE